MKYVTDRFKGDCYAEITVPDGGSFDDMIIAKNNPHIGEEMNKIIGRLAEANRQTGIIDLADFDDEAKLGIGNEKVEKLTKLIAIFQTTFDFKRKRRWVSHSEQRSYMFKSRARQSDGQ